MKNLVLLLMIVLLSLNSYSQSGWQIQKGGSPQMKNYYLDMFFFGDGTGWILTKNGIMNSTNNGDNWTNRFFKDTAISYVSKIFFVDHSNGWMLGNRFFRTSNAGINWIAISSPVNVKSFHFVNLLTGWYCGNGGTLNKTVDGGHTWTTVTTGVSENFNDVYFLNSQMGIVAADAGKILRTTNGGTNWSVFSDNITYSYMQKIKFVDNNTGFVSGSFGYIFKTTNAGASWNILNSGNFNVIKDMAFTNSLTGYTAGLNGYIYRTTNGGVSWYMTSSSGFYSNSINIELASSGRLWLIADSAGVYKSDNNASSWNEVYRLFITDLPLLSIRFFNQTTGCACGDSGIIVRTTNAGTNWSIINSGTNAALRKLYFTNISTGFAAGGFTRSIILKTTNSGSNWFQVNSDSTSYLNSVFFLNQQTGWACGQGISNILKTTNEGLYWFKLNTTDLLFQLKDINFVDANTGFLINNLRCYKTTNGGNNWVTLPGTTGGYCLSFTNSNAGMYLGSAGASYLYKTSNGGTNWVSNLIGPSTICWMHFVNQSKGWVCGNYEAGKIKLTTNGGQNWVQQDVSINVGLSGIYFVNENVGWACGEFGTLLHTTTGGIGINRISNSVPQSFVLHQNYPNPFNPETFIRIDVPSFISRGAGVVLKIYDIRGREITTLVNEKLQPGEYEAEFDGTNLSSGLYFCRLASLNYNQTIKMILLK